MLDIHYGDFRLPWLLSLRRDLNSDPRPQLWVIVSTWPVFVGHDVGNPKDRQRISGKNSPGRFGQPERVRLILDEPLGRIR